MQRFCQGGEFLQAQPLPSDGFGQSASLNGLSQLLFGKAAAVSGGEGVKQGFTPLCEGGFDQAENGLLPGARARG